MCRTICKYLCFSYTGTTCVGIQQCVADTCVIHILCTGNRHKTPHIYYKYGTNGHVVITCTGGNLKW